MILRELSLDDVEKATGIDRRCFSEAVAYPMEIFEECILSSVCETVGLEKDGELVGFFIVFYSGPASTQIVTIDVDPDHRGQGAGNLLMEELEHRARHKGVRRLFLQVSVDNLSAQRLYKKFNYRLRRILQNYYGPGLHAYLMEKKLAETARASGL
ncbi:MAG: GNAT family N-acetyltransferase [bacterium]